MNARTLSLELAAIQSRTNKVIGLSFAIHAALILWLALHHTLVGPPAGLTEISFIDPAPPAPAGAVVVPNAPVQKVKTFLASLPQAAEHFVRKTNEADFAPTPQDEGASEDKIHRELAAFERRSNAMSASIANIESSSGSSRPALAGVPGGTGPRTNAVSLSRGVPGGTGTGSSPISLGRGGTGTGHGGPASLSPIVERGVAAAAAKTPPKIETAESSSKRIIGDATITGPVADRPLISYSKPQYPEWAKNEGVEATLNLYFIVLSDGRVKENILIQKTSGFEDFDDNAVQALKTWRFQPLKKGQTGEQWGAITINYRLSG